MRPARARRMSSLLLESISGSISTVKPGNQAAKPPPKSLQPAKSLCYFRCLRLGASSVPRHSLAPHQQGYSALSFLVYGSSIMRP